MAHGKAGMVPSVLSPEEITFCTSIQCSSHVSDAPVQSFFSTLTQFEESIVSVVQDDLFSPNFSPFPHFPGSGLMPPKRSRGKPALSRVPFLEGVNGDSDFSGSGENCCPAPPEPGEHISEHPRSQSCTNYPGWSCLGTVTCFVPDLGYCIDHSSCFHLSWLPVPCVLLEGCFL